MAVDRYTKVVLTVIAVCLVWLSIGGPSLVIPVSAQTGDRVILAGWMDASGTVRSFPLVFNGDDQGENRAKPRALPIWQENK
jgi:hypothetical protein